MYAKKQEHVEIHTEIILRATRYMPTVVQKTNDYCGLVILPALFTSYDILIGCSAASVFHLLCDLVSLRLIISMIVNNNTALTEYSFSASVKSTAQRKETVNVSIEFSGFLPLG